MSAIVVGRSTINIINLSISGMPVDMRGNDLKIADWPVYHVTSERQYSYGGYLISIPSE